MWLGGQFNFGQTTKFNGFIILFKYNDEFSAKNVCQRSKHWWHTSLPENQYCILN